MRGIWHSTSSHSWRIRRVPVEAQWHFRSSSIKMFDIPRCWSHSDAVRALRDRTSKSFAASSPSTQEIKGPDSEHDDHRDTENDTLSWRLKCRRMFPRYSNGVTKLRVGSLIYSRGQLSLSFLRRGGRARAQL